MKSLFKGIWRIIRAVWSTLNFIRVAFLNALFFMLLFFIIGLYALFNPTENVELSIDIAPRPLVLNLNGPIVEQSKAIAAVDSISAGLLDEDMPIENELYQIVKTLRYAAKDDEISGLVLNLKDLPETNLTKLRYVAKALNEFKSHGKKIYAYSDTYNQSQYYLASYADKILLSSNGAVLLKGYSAFNLYYKDLLDNLDVSTHIFRVGTYKSAVEPLMRNDMSDASKEATTAWLSQLWTAYVDDVATNRDIEPSTLNPSMDSFLQQFKAVKGNLAQLALNLKLVDQLTTRQEANAILDNAFRAKGEESYTSINYYDYLETIPDYTPNTANHIGVIVASGTILDGKQPNGTVGGDSTATLLKQARLDPYIKAVILRVDSPGGSAFASEVIRNEVEALQKAGIPVVVSMSSLAASGGYWISMNADTIIAQPTTLTGSIGIFGVITTFEKGLNKLGVHTDGIGTSPFSGVGLTTGLSDGASEAMQLGIEHGYNQFISLVANGRDMTPTEVDHIAQGRVWTGQDALKNGLVDKLGDFDDAITEAKKLAKVESSSLVWIEKPMSQKEKLMKDLLNSVDAVIGTRIESYIPSALLPVTKQMNQGVSLLESFNDPKGYYSFCLNCEAI